MNNLEKLSQGIVHERTLAGIATSDTFIEGLNIGINRGYNLGHDEGYDDGFDQGYNDARSVAALLEAQKDPRVNTSLDTRQKQQISADLIANCTIAELEALEMLIRLKRGAAYQFSRTTVTHPDHINLKSVTP
jgi:flagellar biosynthesis/type III secretory pathway protein FliH